MDDRRLSLAASANVDDLLAASLQVGGHFSCFLAWDAGDATSAEIAHVAEFILDAGAVSVSCWGADCERVHNVLDEMIGGKGEGTGRYSQSVMTTWHVRESFEEALWYALVVAQPTELFEQSCQDSIFILMNQPDRLGVLREALQDPARFATSLPS